MAPRSSTWPLIVALAAAAGCADDVPASDSGVPDGASDAGPDAGLAVTPPEIPWLEEGVPPIMLAPCPDGWREVVVEGVTECDPYPAEGPATCEAGEAHFPGEAGCRPIGEPCPAGDYAATLPTDGSVVYVNPAAPAGGDGSLAAPYAGLTEINWIWLSPGATVALAKGTYEGGIQVKEGVRIVGACARDTRVTGQTARDRAVVSVINGVGEAVVENLTIGPSPRWGVLASGGRTLVLDGVLIEETRELGIILSDAGTAITLTDSVVRNTQPETSGGTEGQGIIVGLGAHLTATRVVVDRNQMYGVSVNGAGAGASLTDVAILDTQPRASDRAWGRGLNVQLGATVNATRLLLANNHEVGVFIGGEGAVVTLTDVVIRDTQPRARDDTNGRGLVLQDGADLTAERLVIAGHHELSLFLSESGTTATLTDAVIRDTQGQVSDATWGRGVNVQFGAQLAATRLLVARNRDVGVQVSGVGTSVTLTDVAVRDTGPEASDDTGGRAVNVQEGASLTATRLVVVRGHEVGILVTDEGSALTFSDVVVSETRPQARDGISGRGLGVQLSARCEGRRLSVDNSFEFAVLAAGGSFVDLEDVTVSAVSRSACTASTCVPDIHGHGAAAIDSTLRLFRFDIDDAATCGVFLSPSDEPVAPVSVDLESGTVSNAAIGVCLQVDGYDIGRLQRDVEYRDNDLSLDSTTLPVPEPLDPVEN